MLLSYNGIKSSTTAFNTELKLFDLYDSATMPPALAKANQALDRAVDLCYRPQSFSNETKRIEFLFELYDEYTAGMLLEVKNNRQGKKKVV